MIDRGKHDVLGVQVDAVDYEAAVDRIIAAAKEGRAYSVTALAVHGVVTASRDDDLRARVNGMHLVTPDGQPVRWALNRMHNARLDDRVYGPDLTLKVLADCARDALPVYFYGSTPEVLEALVAQVVSREPGLIVAGSEPSKFRAVDEHELTEIAGGISASGAKVCFVGLGCPRQEVFTAAIRQFLPMPALAVGAAFDFHADLLPQAPRWMQERGLEWLYRLKQEPRRLWRRYVFTNLYFLLGWARQTSGHRWPPSGEAPPAAEVPG